MFHSISWATFLTYLLVALTIYWVAVCLIYYNREIVSVIKKGSGQPENFDAKSNGIDTDRLFDECNDCAAHLKSIIRQYSLNNIDKDTILTEAKDFLKQHPQMFKAKWQTPINNLIEYECKQHCDIDIDYNDLRSIWRK